MADALLELANVETAYGRSQVLFVVSFASPAGQMVTLLRELKRELTILLIEHDMDAVFALADRITVVVYGRIVASGEPAAIRANEDVRKAYLGEQDSHG